MLSHRFISAGEAMCNMYDFVASPYLRRSFVLPSCPDSAELTVSALGFYELYVNGNRITKGFLSPYISNSDDLVYYDRYDLKPYLTQGENVIGLQLGNGMQNAFGGYVWDFDKAPFRSAPKTAVWCEVKCGGQTVSFEADKSFVTAPSPIYYDDLRMGERYDANREIPGWNLPGFDDSSWTPAISVATPKGEARLCQVLPITANEERKPIAIWKEGEDYIYDFGINAAGLCRLTVRGKAGQRITLVHAESIRNGKFFYDNIRFPWPQYADFPLYLQLDEYTCRGGETETYMPRFTYHGFRYVRVSGITAEQATPELLTYVIMNTTLELRGGFGCSHPILNRLQEMTRTSTKANFFHFPTDCPHREKNGWTADAALSTEQALLNFEPDDNYVEWLRNIVAAQTDEGKLPGIIPTGGWGFQWGNGPAWDSVLTEIPYQLYRIRGDLRGAEVTADAIRHYIDYIRSRTKEDGTIEIGLGDWCAPHDPIKSPLAFTDSVECVDICTKAASMFRALGREEDAVYAETTANDFRSAIRKNLCDLESMTFAGNCQTSQAMALYYGLCLTDEEVRKAVAVLRERIAAQNGHIDTGVLGARVIFRVLAENGYVDEALAMMTRPDAPSYGNWVANGETSLLEDFSNGQNYLTQSKNHHFFGDISAFFIEYLAGIRVDFRKEATNPIFLSPYFADSLDSAHASHVTPKGRVDVNWQKNGENHINYEISLPDGMTVPLLLHDGYRTNDGKTELTVSSGVIELVKD